MQKDNMMITGDALLDLATGIKLNVAPNRVGIFTTAARQSSGDIFPGVRLEEMALYLEYKVSSDYALAAKMYKAGMHLKNSMAWCLNFLWVGYLPQ